MNRKKLIIFDWGRVLEGYDGIPMCGEEFIKKVLADIDIQLPHSLLDTFTKTLDINHNFEKSMSDVNEHIIKAFNSVNLYVDALRVSDFIKAFIGKSIALNTGNREILRWMENHKGVDYALLSNCGQLDLVRQSITAPEYLFKYVLRSCECGLEKPEVPIYLHFEKMLECKYDILFIDDKQDNLVVPEELDWKTFLYEGDNDKLFECLEMFLAGEMESKKDGYLE